MKKVLNILTVVLKFIMGLYALIITRVLVFLEDMIKLLNKVDNFFDSYVIKSLIYFIVFIALFYIAEEIMFYQFPVVTMLITISCFIVFIYVFFVLFYHDQLITKTKFIIAIAILSFSSWLIFSNTIDGDYKRFTGYYISDNLNTSIIILVLLIYSLYKIVKIIFIYDALIPSAQSIFKKMVIVSVIIILTYVLSYVMFDDFVSRSFLNYKEDYIAYLKIFYTTVSMYIAIVILIWMTSLLFKTLFEKKREIHVRSNFVTLHRNVVLFALMIPTFISIFFVAFENAVPYDVIENYSGYNLYKAFRSIVSGFGSVVIPSASFSVLFLIYIKLTEPKKSE